MKELLRFWEARRGQHLAMATLVAARGSSYRRPGARMLIDGVGKSAGGVSAGCIEEEVIACAQKVLRDGVPQLMQFDTRRRFGCHGTIEVFVERIATAVLMELRECQEKRRDLQLATAFRGGAAGTRLAGFGETDEAAFVQTITPPLRLVIIGETADTTALQMQALLLNWDIVQWEGVSIPGELLLDDRTAVVLATHNFGRDCAALRSLLPAGLKYLGLIGSRRRRDDILFDVIQVGLECTSALFAPAGLHLGADTPEEIALSIVAEIQTVFASASAEPLRQRKAAIHTAATSAIACQSCGSSLPR